MKQLLITGLIALSTTVGVAQNGHVNIQEDNRIKDLLSIYKSSNESHDYYKIQVGFGSYAKAQRIKENVEIDFPDLFSKIDFDSPTYRVRVGRFKTKLEAERKFIEVRAKYPDAMLLKPKKST
ncbi:SPOR domain-containing protein [Maribacter sp. TH_r10]|uniref:SPOR domain-containing protein n=1 Tax=Maribacter luteus TaxID=2594478 RepID=A0A6I2MKU7_9FLAO|nr:MULTISPECIES: SPOR domain-containing protein [Maribacter]MDV7139958.1 SPOR domain-containing protein [Maribacter sp. TH_r10]MRX63397.1 SPOR domain-containing protein [Maribacter luteus]|tara:strand:- start:6135 stop:6503 length:369 start_codon:yes stop_codon:yes gene_type:complete